MKFDCWIIFGIGVFAGWWAGNASAQLPTWGGILVTIFYPFVGYIIIKWFFKEFKQWGK